MKPVAWSGGFNETARIAFSSCQSEKSCSTETMYSKTKNLMTLEDSHLQTAKRPKRGFVDARYL